MFKTSVPIIFVACAVLASASTSKAQQFTTQKPGLSEEAWHNHGWGFAGAGVYNEKDPSKRKRLAGLLHIAHVYAATQLCPDVELIHANIAQLFDDDGFGSLSPKELSFVGGRISDLKIWRKMQTGEEVCQWAFENYGPEGAMYPGLIGSRSVRSGDPEATSSVAPPNVPRQAPLPPRRPRNL
jgi:hypothetical protein